MKKWSLVIISILLAMSALFVGCSPKIETSSPSTSTETESTEKEAEAGQFNIGMAISMTGGTALFGEGVRQGALLAIEEFNAAGGYNGQTANLVLYDDEAKPEKSVEVVQKLINQDKIVALIGPANSGNALAHIQ